MNKYEYNKRWSEANPDKVKEASRKHYQENRDRIQQQRAEYYKKYPERQRLRACKYRAKKLGVPFDLTSEDLISPDVCPVLGIPLIQALGAKGPSDNSPSVDRIFPEKGYIKGNVRVISNRANLLKNSITLKELEALYKDIKELYV